MLQKKHLRLAAGIFALLLLAAVLLSAFFLAKEAGHCNCACENCPVCACLRLCRSILTQLLCPSARRAAVAALRPYVFALALLFVFAAADDTPVARKVRLDS